MAFLIVYKIKVINDIDYLSKQYTIFHILIGIGKSGLHDDFTVSSIKLVTSRLSQNGILVV